MSENQAPYALKHCQQCGRLYNPATGPACDCGKDLSDLLGDAMGHLSDACITLNRCIKKADRNQAIITDWKEAVWRVEREIEGVWRELGGTP